MANNNHLFSVPCYNGTMLKQDYYNNFFDIGQQNINFSFYELGLPLLFTPFGCSSNSIQPLAVRRLFNGLDALQFAAG
jgi:hypothetical protein